MIRLILFLIIVAALVAGLIYVFWGGDGNKMPIPESGLDFTEANNSPLGNSPLDADLPADGVPATIQKSNMQPPTSIDLEQGKVYMARLKTSEGDIYIELNTAQTPVTAYNFIYLARQDFYDDTIFHRVMKGFMIQGGDPKGDGTGGPGYRFNDEPFEGEYTRGTVAMANSGANTNGSQFFIMHQDYPLQPNYVIFGKVARGIEVVDKIAEAEVAPNTTGESSKPVNPVKILDVEILEIIEE